MATNLAKVPLFRAISARGYASLAPLGGKSNYDVHSSVLPNNLVVASAENDCAIARVSLIFRAGARNETPETLGASHILRIAAGLSTCNASQFAIMRNIQQAGANLSVTADREVISYTLEGTDDAIERIMPYLTEVATKQVFKPWEVSDNLHRVKLELATRPPQQRAVDLLHKAAYRKGLGNSLYISKHQLGKISSETLQHYVATNFVAGKAAVVGLGINQTQLSQYAQTLDLGTGEGCTEPAAYKGGEIRSDKGGDFAFIAAAGEGGSLCNFKEAMAFKVLQYVLGAAPSCKRGNGCGSLHKGNESAAQAVSALNVSYADSGLFGVLIAAEAEKAGATLIAALKVLRSGCVPEGDICRAKNSLKTAMLSEMESGTKAIQIMGTFAAVVKTAYSPKQISDYIDAVSAADVNDAAKKVASSKLSIASVGNLKKVPFLDEFC